MGDVEPDEIDYDNPPFNLTAIDREILATKDEDYHRITWADLKRIIGEAKPPTTYPNDCSYSAQRTIP
jgi:hypothetical protein